MMCLHMMQLHYFSKNQTFIDKSISIVYPDQKCHGGRQRRKLSGLNGGTLGRDVGSRRGRRRRRHVHAEVLNPEEAAAAVAV